MIFYLKDSSDEHLRTTARSFSSFSVGGLVTQRALNISRESRFPHLRRIETCTVGIGTPHHGADLATWGAILADIVNIIKPANRNVVKLLKRGSEILVDVQDAFHNVLEKRKEEQAKIEITCFYELLPVVRSCVVPKESAIMGGSLNTQFALTIRCVDCAREDSEAVLTHQRI